MSLNSACGQCNGEPGWRITRRGDVVTSWACDAHVATECDRLQRDSEVTELVVVHYGKLVEYVEITRTLRAIAEGGAA
jgi:hypothetical protein